MMRDSQSVKRFLTGFEVGFLRHDVLERSTSVAVLAHLDEQKSDVPHYIQAVGISRNFGQC